MNRLCLRRRLARLCIGPLLGSAALIACSSAPEPLPSAAQATGKASSALDPNQVFATTGFKITLTSLQVLQAQEPYQTTVTYPGGTSGITPIKGEPDSCKVDEYGECSIVPWSPDTGYHYVAQLGVLVRSSQPEPAENLFNSGNPATPACDLGGPITGPTTLTGCTGPALGQSGYATGQALSQDFTMNPNDVVTLGLVLDNVETAAAMTVTSNLGSPETIGGGLATAASDIKTFSDGLALAAAGFSLGGEPIPAAMTGLLGAAGSVVGDVIPIFGNTTSTTSCTCGDAETEALQAISCTGGLFGGLGIPSSGVCETIPSIAPPDTMVIRDPATVDPSSGQPSDFTAERLLELTAAGPYTFTFSPSYDITTFGAVSDNFVEGDQNQPCGVSSRNGPDQPIWMGGCASKLNIQITIERTYDDFSAPASAKSGDMATLSNTSIGRVDVVGEGEYSTLSEGLNDYPNHIVHYWGSGGSFQSELDSAGEALEGIGANIATEPVIVSRDAGPGTSAVNIDAFWADSKGFIDTIYQAAPGDTWQAQSVVSPPTGWVGDACEFSPSIVPANALVTATARTPQNLDVFFVGTDGNVYDAYWNTSLGTNSQGRAWGLTAITKQGCTATNACAGSGRAGTSVAVVARQPTMLDVFYIGEDGGVWTSSYNSKVSSAWTTSEAIYNPDLTNSNLLPLAGYNGVTSHLTATARSSDNMDVFWVGATGALWNATWIADTNGGSGAWSSTPTRLTADGAGKVGGEISAVGRQPDALDVIFTGANGELEWSTWAKGGAAWPAPQAVLGAGSVGPGGMSLLATTNFALQAFYFNPAHQIGTMTWTDPDQCNFTQGQPSCTTGGTLPTVNWVPQAALVAPPAQPPVQTPPIAIPYCSGAPSNPNGNNGGTPLPHGPVVCSHVPC